MKNTRAYNTILLLKKVKPQPIREADTDGPSTGRKLMR